MRERTELILKGICALFAVLVLYRLVLMVAHFDPLYHATIPALPSLTAGKGATNNSAMVLKTVSSTQNVAGIKATNSTLRVADKASIASNHIDYASSKIAEGSNSASHASNQVVSATNSVSRASNVVAQSTNTGALGADTKGATNSSEALRGARSKGPPIGGPPGMPPGFAGMPPGGMPGMPKPGPSLAPEVQARIDRVIDSEILAPVMRPMPMALLGIAGKDVFFRAPNGQTGLIKEGDELGGVKLIRVGVNRILVEEQGERKELTIFAGLGSESLLSTQKNGPK